MPPSTRLLWLSFVLVAGCGSKTELVTGALHLTFDAKVSTITLTRGGDQLVELRANAFQLGVVPALDDQLSYDPFWLFTTGATLPATQVPGLRWRVPTGAVYKQVSAKEVRASLTYEGGVSATATFTLADDGRFAARWVPTVAEGSPPVAFMRLQAHVGETEGLYGLGEWFDEVNHRGQLRPMQIEADLDVESSYMENHVTVPLLVGGRGWGLFVESKRFGTFDVARTDPTLVDTTWGTAEQSSDGLTFHLLGAATPLDVMAPYYRLTGFPKPPSPWALGPWIWRDENRDQAEVLDDIRQIRTLDLATSGIWIDRPYASEVNSFDFDPTKFNDPPGMINAAHRAGLRVALWHTPYLETTATALLAEAEQKGYFPPAHGLLLNKWGVPLDFTNAAATSWWSEHLQRYISLGIEGFKLDYAEDVAAGLAGRGTGWRFSDGSTERTMQYGYPLLYHHEYRSVLPVDGFILARAGKWGDQVNGLIIWPGDIDARLVSKGETFHIGTETHVAVGGLPAAVRAGVGLSMSGFPFFAADTGGYLHSPPDRETFIRWVENSALGTVMQTGDSSSQPPWVYTPENGRDVASLDLYRRYARLHLRLFPYFWTHITRIAKTGRPVLRPFGVSFPSLGVDPSDQYLVGDDLLVAPVDKYGITSRTVKRPPGTWTQWFDGTQLVGTAGEEQTVSAPLEMLPLYARAGALVPMLRPTIDTLSPAEDPDVDSFANDVGALWVRVVPGATGYFELYDGTVLDMPQANGTRLVASGGSVFTSAVVFEVVSTAKPASVFSGGVALAEVADEAALTAAAKGWLWRDELGGTVVIKAPLPASVELR